MSQPTSYGKYYWCIKTPLSPDGEIYAYADFVEITMHGDLILSREKDGTSSINLSLAAGQWSAIYAASVLDGVAVAVEYWAGEVVPQAEDDGSL